MSLAAWIGDREIDGHECVVRFVVFFSNLDLFPNDIESYESVELEGRTTLAGGSRYFQPIRIDL